MKKVALILFIAHQYLALPAYSQDNNVSVQQQVWSITEVMYHDVVNPPAAARFYAYSLLGGYETLRQFDTELPDLNTKLKGFASNKSGYNLDGVHKEFAVMYAILETGKNIIPSGNLLADKQQELSKIFEKSGVNKSSIDNSIVLAKEIASRIVQYAKTDGYFKLSTLQRYKPYSNDSCWRPTPPEYMAAVEPHWRTIRTFFLDSARQYPPVAAVYYNKETSSPFMTLAKEVYETGNKLTEEQKLIANFWDCNPFAVQFQGHMSIGLKKISPGGHWMGITGIAAKKAGLDFNNTLLLHTVTALTLHDAFTSCWDEKYRSNRIRPETFINRYVDPKWKPLLQTPPFPEYSSGHSVISTAAAVVLTHFLGEGFSFIDTTETYIGLPPRTFNSFHEAAAEARISRLYGGIHFRDAIENGGEQGRRIGEYVVRRAGLNVKFKM